MSDVVYKFSGWQRGEPDKVCRKDGASYSFNGFVLIGFLTLAGKVRYVVEHETEKGMLHIFNEDSLESRG